MQNSEERKSSWRGACIAIASVVLFGVILIVLALFSSPRECQRLWIGKGVAWLDSNGNGSWDGAEPSLPDIRMHADDVFDRYHEMQPAITDQSGIAHIEIIVDACPNPELNIHPDVPAGYRLTTQPSFHIKEDASGDIEYDKLYYFGFEKLSN